MEKWKGSRGRVLMCYSLAFLFDPSSLPSASLSADRHSKRDYSLQRRGQASTLWQAALSLHVWIHRVCLHLLVYCIWRHLFVRHTKCSWKRTHKTLTRSDRTDNAQQCSAFKTSNLDLLATPARLRERNGETSRDNERKWTCPRGRMSRLVTRPSERYRQTWRSIKMSKSRASLKPEPPHRVPLVTSAPRSLL